MNGRARSHCAALLAAVGLLAILAVCASSAAAQSDDPASVVAAYVSALNAHDVAGALALFDQNGSATDGHGRHFEGRAGLTSFLLANGFAAPGSNISTEGLQVVGNRALWTYRCSCATESTDVRVVVNHSKIVVFFMGAPGPAATSAPPTAGPALVWSALLGAAMLLGVLLLNLYARSRLARPAPRPAQGRLLAGLVRSRELKNAATRLSPRA